MLLLHFISYIIRLWNGESETYKETYGRAQFFERKMAEMRDLPRMKKEEIINELGKPNRTKALPEGGQRLIWKGRKYKVEVYFDKSDRFSHKEESYT